MDSIPWVRCASGNVFKSSNSQTKTISYNKCLKCTESCFSSVVCDEGNNLPSLFSVLQIQAELFEHCSFPFHGKTLSKTCLNVQGHWPPTILEIFCSLDISPNQDISTKLRIFQLGSTLKRIAQCPVWAGVITQRQSRSLERFQRKAVATLTWKDYKSGCSELNLVTLSTRLVGDIANQWVAWTISSTETNRIGLKWREPASHTRRHQKSPVPGPS